MVDTAELFGRLRPFQRAAAQYATKRGRSLYWAPPGSGKTVVALATLAGAGVSSTDPVLINGSSVALAAWTRQIPLWLGIDSEQILVIRGNHGPDRRAKMWKSYRDYSFVICTYETLRQDLKRGVIPIQWAAQLGDEFHKCRNHRTQNWAAYKQIKPEIEMVMTGSPMRHNANDAFTMVNRMDPKLWSSYWRYANTYCYVMDNGFGNEVIGTKNTKAFAQLIGRYGTWYEKRDIEGQMPKLNKVYLDVEMDAKTEKVYRQLEGEFFTELPLGGIIATPNKMTSLLRLRQILACPKILDEELPYGSGIEAIVELLEAQPHLAVYTPFRGAIPFIKQRLEAEGYDAGNIYTITGGMDPSVLNDTVAAFLKNRGILLGTIQSAESYSLSTCDTSVFLGYDWSWDVNEQCEDRIRRLDSTGDFANVHYIRYGDSVDEDVMDNIIFNRTNIKQYSKHRRHRII